MNRILAFLFFMLFLAAFAFIMLKDMPTIDSDRQAGTHDPVISIVSGDWRGPDSDSGGASPITQTVRFEADGGISGFGGCNSFFGSYVATDSTLEIGPLGITRKKCPESVMRAEAAFVRSMESAVNYSIRGTVLTLITADADNVPLHLSETGNQPGSENHTPARKDQ